MNIEAALYVVATPIGNREDISMRAQAVLASVDVIAAEDTRYSGVLLTSFGIKTSLVSLHEHNEREVAESLLVRLKQGQSIALISDAGTPLLSDPGYFLVRRAQEENIKVIPIPGACAAITALSAAGLPSDRFCFEGFLPAKSSQRKNRLEMLQAETRTIIFYESPHRIVESLQSMLEVLGEDREVGIARELTKKFETIKRGSLKEIILWITEDEQQQRGEFVVLVHGAELKENISEQDEFAIKMLKILKKELPLAQAVKMTAAITGLKKNYVYDLGLKI